jgi:glycosyltransferase involved in cell wall biosynthesis
MMRMFSSRGDVSITLQIKETVSVMVRTVLYFADSTYFGGAEQVLLTIFAGLDRRRWRPALVHHPQSELAPFIEQARKLDVKVWTVPRMQGKQDIAWVLRFARAMQTERPAVFHANLNWPLSCTYGLYAAALARIPAVVATQHLYARIRSRRSRLQQQLVSLGVDRYIAVSCEVARQLRQTLWFSAGKVQVIHNGIPLAPFSRSVNGNLRAILTGPREQPAILTVARLHRQKGLHHLLAAAAFVPEAQFVLAGGGPERALLETQARVLGVADHVTFLGHRDDIPDLLASCDLFVLPSLFEGHPLSILEAMAAGKPVIASAVGGTDEAVVHGETGILVPPADPHALALAIRRVISDPALAQRLAAAGEARARQEFSAETMVQRTTQVYEEILSPRGAPHGYH